MTIINLKALLDDMRIERLPTDVRLNLDTEKEVRAFAAALFEGCVYGEFTDNIISDETVETVVSLEQRIQRGEIELPQIINIGSDVVGRTYRLVRDYANGTDEAKEWLASPSSVQSTITIERMELGGTASSMAKVMLGELGPLIFPVVPVQER